ncbi:SDR family NAD(P)-dependent oxidoreductase [Stenotrophomonas tumulicola]|uniref:SDR family NAD(P)-dependent oxidoreductase n=1 Tax=Stenotrophomonas tumulicola TaxID=1685415 RepID=A0A7W3FKR4_9GAMM|nr:SDR family NAD(P)-dependent oxidoreductase [Stenotrophomonas tumulicola]MBA8681328.1 SDR family NAD(P)-dependent oxidoreductase [Stenotrophomonas tumulicola]
MDLQLAGKVALVTGSSKGIGEAIALSLAGEGATVVIHGRGQQDAHEAAQRVVQAGGRAHVATGDIARESDVERIVASARQQAGRIDILVNNAGGSSPHTEKWADTRRDTWESTLNRNLLAAVGFSTLLLPDMRKAGWGRIVNIASAAAIMPPPTNPDYSASKAAMIAMTSSMSKAVAAEGVTVNAISPGTIHSQKLDARFRDIAAQGGDIERDAAWQEIEKRVIPLVGSIPVGRVGTLAEIANVVAFLCSPLAAYVNGVNLRVDGGLFAGI